MTPVVGTQRRTIGNDKWATGRGLAVPVGGEADYERIGWGGLRAAVGSPGALDGRTGRHQDVDGLRPSLILVIAAEKTMVSWRSPGSGPTRSMPATDINSWITCTPIGRLQSAARQ